MSLIPIPLTHFTPSIPSHPHPILISRSPHPSLSLPFPSGLWTLAGGAMAGGDTKAPKKGAVVAAGGATVTLTPGTVLYNTTHHTVQHTTHDRSRHDTAYMT